MGYFLGLCIFSVIFISAVSAQCKDCSKVCECVRAKEESLNFLISTRKLHMVSKVLNHCDKEATLHHHAVAQRDAGTPLAEYKNKTHTGYERNSDDDDDDDDEYLTEEEENEEDLEDCIDDRNKGCFCVGHVDDILGSFDARKKRSIAEQRDMSKDRYDKRFKQCLMRSSLFKALKLSVYQVDAIERRAKNIERCVEPCWRKAQKSCMTILNLKPSDLPEDDGN